MVESTTILFLPESLILNVYQVRYVLRRRGAGGENFFLILLVNYNLFFCFGMFACFFVFLFRLLQCCLFHSSWPIDHLQMT